MTESNDSIEPSHSGMRRKKLLGNDLALLLRGSALAGRLAIAGIGGLIATGQTLAQTLDWDAGSNNNNGVIDGGAGTWDGSTVNWTKNGGGANIVWDPGATARFGGTGGVVKLTGVQTIDGLIFTGSGYVITPDVAASTLQLTGPSTDIDVKNASDTATINAAITGAGGVNVSGPGTLVLNGINTYSGTTRVNGGGTLISTGALNGALTISGSSDALVKGSVNGNIINQNSGTLTINGNLDVANHTLENKGSATVSVTAGQTSGITSLINTSSAAIGVSIASGATLAATTISNASGSTIANSGALASVNAIQNSGTLTNAVGASISAAIDNNGALTSAGIITGNLTNSGSGIATLQGDLSGNIVNQNLAKLIISGNLALANNSVENKNTATISITAGEMHGISTLNNTSTAATGVSIGIGAALTAANITNAAGSTIANSGALASTITPIKNDGRLTNAAGAAISGGITNTGILISQGTLTGNLTNTGSATLKGDINGNISNESVGAINGSLIINGDLLFNSNTLENKGKATVSVTAGSTTGISAFINTSTAATGVSIASGASLTAAGVSNAAGSSILNNGTLASTAGAIQNDGALVSTGALSGGLSNNGSGSATLRGAVTGNVLNQNSATVNVNGVLAVSGSFANSSNAPTGVSIASGASLTAAGVSNTAGSSILNNGTLASTAGAILNEGKLTSTGTLSGGLTNSGSGSAALRGAVTGSVLNQNSATVSVNGVLAVSGSFANSSNAPTGVSIASGASLTAVDISNASGSTISNNGTLASTNAIMNSGALSNGAAGIISGGVNNTGGLYSLGTINGALTNSGAAQVSISGTLNGPVLNQGSSGFTVIGNLDLQNNTFQISDTSAVVIQAGAVSGITTLTNSSTAPIGLAVYQGAGLSAAAVSNAAGSIIYNAGDLTSASVIQNSGSISNGVTGTINGGINNSGGLYSLGRINGDIANGGGFNNFGTVDGTLTVSAGGSLGGTGGTLKSLILDGGTVIAGSSQNLLGDTTQNSGTMAGSIAGPNSGTYLLKAGSLSGAVSAYASFVQTGGALDAGASINVGAFGSTGGTDAGAVITAPVRAVAVGGQISELRKERTTISNNAGGITFVSDEATVLGNAAAAALTTTTGSGAPTSITVKGGIAGKSGIDATASLAGPINIQTLGAISTDGTAISMKTAGVLGFADIRGNVNVSGADAAFVGAGNTAFSIGSGAIVKAEKILDAQSGQTTLSNAGTLDGGTFSSAGSGAVINNLLGGVINVNGTDLSSFNGASDAFNNSGALKVDGTVTFAGLENFTSASTGRIDLADGAGGDVLTLGGNLSLANSLVFMDVDLSQPQSTSANDIIIVGGELSGKGAVINLTDTSNSVPQIGFVGPTLFRNTSIASGSTFVVTGLDNAGFFEYGLVQNGTNLDLSSKLREQVAGGIVSNFITAQNTVSNAFFKPSSSFVSTPLNPERNQFGFAPWFRTNGGLSKDASEGVAILPSGALQNVSSSVNVAYGGYQFGMDAGLFNIAEKGGNLHFGLTGGQIFGTASQVDFNNKTGMTDTFVGAYSVYSNGPFFVDAQLRQEFIDYTVNVNDLLFKIDDAKVKAQRFSAGFSGGYALKLNDWSIVPAAGYTYSRTTTGDLNIVGTGTSQNSVVTRFADSESHLAFAGVSIATSYLFFDDQLRLSPFVSATAYHDFGKANEASLVIGTGPTASTFNVSSQNGTTYGELSVGANFLTLTPEFGGAQRLLTGNVRGDVQVGKERLGGSLNLQMRLQF